MSEIVALFMVLGLGLMAFCLIAPDQGAVVVRLVWWAMFYVVFPIVVLVKIF